MKHIFSFWIDAIGEFGFTPFTTKQTSIKWCSFSVFCKCVVLFDLLVLYHLPCLSCSWSLFVLFLTDPWVFFFFSKSTTSKVVTHRHASSFGVTMFYTQKTLTGKLCSPNLIEYFSCSVWVFVVVMTWRHMTARSKQEKDILYLYYGILSLSKKDYSISVQFTHLNKTQMSICIIDCIKVVHV